MENAILIALFVNAVLLSVLIVLAFKNYKGQEVEAMYFTDISDVEGYLKRQKKVQIKCQLLKGKVPLGQPFIVSEQIVESADSTKLAEIVKNVSQPLLQAGLKVATKQFLK